MTEGIKHRKGKDHLWWWASKAVVGAVAILFVGIMIYAFAILPDLPAPTPIIPTL